MRYMRSILLAVATGSSMPALAHMPYVQPSAFDAGKRDRVTIEASFSEDPFRPEVAMKDAPFEVTGPDGQTRPLDRQTLLADLTVLEAPLPADGV
jgi:hypothetical protein